tara:strand:- start:548 stop:946 length:399 start_codon:yes stop_codon:yes gene_type:complete
MKYLLSFFVLIIVGCESQISNSDIIQQGYFINDNKDRINTYYIYDFVSKEKIKKHGIQSENSKGSVTTNFYFSHNGNIPNQKLRYAKTLSDAYKIIGEYSFYVKYVYDKNSSGEMKFVDCSQIPKDDFCTPN